MRVNTHQLLSEVLYDSQGNVENQIDMVYELFLQDLFDVGMAVHLEKFAGRYAAKHDGYVATGSTPAEAVANLIKNLRNSRV